MTAWPRKAEIGGGVHFGNTDQNGDFSITDFGPGEYWIAALESLPPSVSNDASFLGPFQEMARSIRLEQGSRASEADSA